MHILHICGHKRSIPSPAIFRPAICRALRSRSVSHFESDRIIYAIENIGLIILKRPLRDRQTLPWHAGVEDPQDEVEDAVIAEFALGATPGHGEVGQDKFGELRF